MLTLHQFYFYFVVHLFPRICLSSAIACRFIQIIQLTIGIYRLCGDATVDV